MSMRMVMEEISPGVWRHHHGRHGIFESRELCREELARRLVGGARKIAVELSLPQEVPPEHLRDREHHPGVGYVRENLSGHSLGPEKSTLLAA